MKQLTKMAVQSDDTLSDDQKQAIIATCNGRNLTHSESIPLFLTQAQTAKTLNVSRVTVYRMVADGQLHPVDIRGVKRYPLWELEALAGGRS